MDVMDAGQVDLGGGKRPLSPVSPIINNFSIAVATVNGTGSQTANLALLRACCQMGIPVNGKIFSLPIFKGCQPGSIFA